MHDTSEHFPTRATKKPNKINTKRKKYGEAGFKKNKSQNSGAVFLNKQGEMLFTICGA